MKICVQTKAFIAICLFLMSGKLWASNCSDVLWKSNVLEKFPDISQYCQGVVESGGRELVEFKAKFLSEHAGRANLKFMHPDGSYGDTFKTDKLGANYKIMLDGKETAMRDVPRNSELTVYMPPDRFLLISDIESWSTQEPVAVMFAFEESVLPGTASSLPLIGLSGLGLCFLGFLMTIIRRFHTARSRSPDC